MKQKQSETQKTMDLLSSILSRARKKLENRNSQSDKEQLEAIEQQFAS